MLQGQPFFTATARALGSALRLLCVLAIAVVTTLHVCNAANGRIVDVVTLSAEADGGCPAAPQAVEKCHTCALASLPAILAAGQSIDVAHVIPSGSTLQVDPFNQPTVGPPPRA